MLDVERHIVVIGLGYVGWPLYMLLSNKYDCCGLDADIHKVEMIREDYPRYQNITTSWNDIVQCNTFIIAVSTPIDSDMHPDTPYLEQVCKGIVNVIKTCDIIIFESTVFPGATEELCIPIIESGSGLKLNQDFYVGYSPERINVADSIHKLENTAKIVSASNSEALSIIANLYDSIIDAPIIKVSAIKVAESAKMYENVQRDVLITLANEYSKYCAAEDIDVFEVTKYASTKWNFANITPGLVGEHCIGVDPYYLLHRAKKLGIDIPFVQCGRDINESKSMKVASRIIRFISTHSLSIKNPKILLLSFMYKANTLDTRNTKVAEIYNKLKDDYSTIDCYDPLGDIEYVDFELFRKILEEGDKLWNGKDEKVKKSHKDVDARWTVKRVEKFYGYKDHAKIDVKSKLIDSYHVTSASVHYSQCSDVLITDADDGQDVWMNAGYVGKDEDFKKKNVNPIICEKGFRNHPLAEEQKKSNRLKSKVSSRVEHVFGFIEQSMKGLIFRGVGMVRATFNIGLTNLVYNIFRYAQLIKWNAVPVNNFY